MCVGVSVGVDVGVGVVGEFLVCFLNYVCVFSFFWVWIGYPLLYQPGDYLNGCY